MKNADAMRIWFCDCGRIHIETQFHRTSFLPVQFLNLLRNGTEKASAESGLPQQSYLQEACEPYPASYAAEGQRSASSP